MAIVIPSKNIYEKDNDKIRDNAIDRIEVGAVEIVPDNRYEEAVYNESVNTSDVTTAGNWQEDFQCESVAISTYDTAVYGAVVGIAPFYKRNLQIKLPKVKNNSYISKLFTGEKTNDTTKEVENNIKHTVEYIKLTGECTVEGYAYSGSGRADVINSKTLNYNNNLGAFKGDLPKKVEHSSQQSAIKAEKSITDETNLGSEKIIIEETDDYWLFSITILCGVEIYTADCYISNGKLPSDVTLTGTCEKYVPQSVEITFYGNTIGIDLVDKTVYIPDGKGDKPFSVEGNELMQTTNVCFFDELVRFEDYAIEHYDDRGQPIYNGNIDDYNNWDKGFSAYVSISKKSSEKYYGKHLKVRSYDGDAPEYYSDDDFYPTSDNNFIYVDSGGYHMGKVEVFLCSPETAIQTFYSKTKEQYANGKETATIRCSISDYYDYDTKEKIISIDGSTKKMAFDIYDKVIPMAYGANGKDKPLSRYKNGKPKVFQVLGSRIFYDGAVWQELTLQEIS